MILAHEFQDCVPVAILLFIDLDKLDLLGLLVGIRSFITAAVSESRQLGGDTISHSKFLFALLNFLSCFFLALGRSYAILLLLSLFLKLSFALLLFDLLNLLHCTGAMCPTE